jgi:hypothetical protein
MSGYTSLSREIVSGQQSPAYLTNATREIRVPTRTLDGLLRELFHSPIRTLVIKIDVEGFEDRVLDGARDTLLRCDWWRAIVEFSLPALEARGVDAIDIWRKLRAFSGEVLDGRYGRTPVTSILKSRLPEIPPRHCNVVIGQGTMEARVRERAAVDEHAFLLCR